MASGQATSILNGAESYTNFQAGSQCVMCIHGFAGNPAEMRYLSEKLEAAGYSVSVPRLPGHGTSIDDMLSTRRQDWFGAVRQAYLECAAHFDTIYIVGLSMGGVLAAMLAAEFAPAGLVLISTPHTISNPAIYAAPVLGRLIRVLPLRNPTLGINDDEARRTHICYRQGVPIASTWELFLLIREGIAMLPKVRAPVLVIQSKGDTVIPASSADYIVSHIGSTIVQKIWFQKSNHVITRDHDRDAAAAAVIRFLGAS